MISQSQPSEISNKLQLLIQRAQSGEIDAFGQLYLKYLDPIFRYHIFQTHRLFHSFDLSNQVFRYCWKYLPSIKTENLLAQLILISQQLLKTGKNNQSPSDEIINFLNQQVEGDERATLIKFYSMIKTLAPEYKDLILLKYMEEMTDEELTVALKRSPAAIKVLDRRSLDKIEIKKENLIKLLAVLKSYFKINQQEQKKVIMSLLDYCRQTPQLNQSRIIKKAGINKYWALIKKNKLIVALIVGTILIPLIAALVFTQINQLNQRGQDLIPQDLPDEMKSSLTKKEDTDNDEDHELDESAFHDQLDDLVLTPSPTIETAITPSPTPEDEDDDDDDNEPTSTPKPTKTPTPSVTPTPVSTSTITVTPTSGASVD